MKIQIQHILVFLLIMASVTNHLLGQTSCEIPSLIAVFKGVMLEIDEQPRQESQERKVNLPQAPSSVYSMQIQFFDAENNMRITERQFDFPAGGGHILEKYRLADGKYLSAPIRIRTGWWDSRSKFQLEDYLGFFVHYHGYRDQKGVGRTTFLIELPVRINPSFSLIPLYRNKRQTGNQHLYYQTIDDLMEILTSLDNTYWSFHGESIGLDLQYSPRSRPKPREEKPSTISMVVHLKHIFTQSNIEGREGLTKLGMEMRF